jgi:hypothetical protein
MKVILLLLSFNLFASNLLIIGDSHMAGPFGKRLHTLFTKGKNFDNVITYGHASSSSLHWMSETTYKLSGGVFHQFNNQSNPNPTNWRLKVEVPKLSSVLADPSLHTEWGSAGFDFDNIIIELGANDARAISSQNGVINSREYQRRQSYVSMMINLVKKYNLGCYWIGPPNGIKKTKANQDILYKMLQDTVKESCSFFSSNHFKAIGCDGVHFNCRSELKNAHKWAKEVFNFVNNPVKP